MLFFSALRELSFEINKNVDYLSVGRVKGKLCISILDGHSRCSAMHSTLPESGVETWEGREENEKRRQI